MYPKITVCYMDYTDLRSKTIFDFTDDPKILKKLGFEDDPNFSKKLGTTEKDFFIKRATIVAKAFSIIDYAEYVGNNELFAAVEKEFEHEFSLFFNE